MIRGRRLGVLLVKESRQILRDPSALLIALVVPLVLLFLMGYAISMDARKIPLGVALEGSDAQSRSLLAAFRASPSFDVRTGRDRREFYGAMERGEVRGILVIPAGFPGELARGAPRLQLLADGTEPLLAAALGNYAAGVWERWAREEAPGARGEVRLLSRHWYNAPLNSHYFLLPGSIAVVMTLVGTLLTSLVVAREWERGTMEALMATPLTTGEMLIGKLVPYFVLGMGSMLLCFFITTGLFDVPFRGSVAMLVAVSALYLLPALGLGLLISTLARNQFVAAQASLIAGFLPAFLLSGFLFDIRSMPDWLQGFTYVIPARYLVSALQTLFLAGDVPEVLLPDMAGMAALGALFFGALMAKTRKRLD